MTRPFRLAPPPTAPGSLARTRLLDALGRRWDARLVTLVAGPGFGKTTLLAQAVAENRLDPLGTDLWLTCEPADADAERLAVGLAGALDLPRPTTDVHALAAHLAAAPGPVALVVDDAHLLPPWSSGARLLAELLDEMPVDAHLVVAGRPPTFLRSARLEAQRRSLTIDERAMRFTAEEAAAFAAARGADPSVVDDVGGWPALAELAATAGVAAARRFVEEEVLHQLPDDRRRALVALAAIGAGDAELVAAAAAEIVDLDALVETVPLLDADHDGRVSAHRFWIDLLVPNGAPEPRRRAAAACRARGRPADAVELLRELDDTDALLAAAVDACAVGPTPPSGETLRRWLRSIPDGERQRPAARFLDALARRDDDPLSADAAALLAEARAGFEAAGDVAGEIAVIAQLSYVAWLRHDVPTLGAVMSRVHALAGEGHAAAIRLEALGAAVVADAREDHDAVIAHVGVVTSGPLTDDHRALAEWLRSNALLLLGRPDDALAAAETAASRAGPGFLAARAAPVLVAWWAGDPLRADTSAADLAGGETQDRARFLWSLWSALAAGWTARVERPAADFDAGRWERHVGTPRETAVAAAAEAALAVARGDDQRARDALVACLERHPMDAGGEAALRRFLALPYVLVPSTRAAWDAAPLGPCWAEARRLARAYVALREDGAVEAIDWPEPGRALSVLPLPWTVALAAADVAAGSEAGRAVVCWLLAGLRTSTQSALRSVAADGAHPPAVARAARRLLAELPVPPADPVDVRVLGPTELRRGGVVVDDPDWRRERVRSLLLYLVARVETRREAVAAALWPELDDRATARNLAVTLGYLHGVLEPHRVAGDATWFIRADGQSLRLAPVEGLRVDAWELERLLDEADAADAARAPSVTLDVLRRAVPLWRGDYLADVAWDDWAGVERDRLRARFVAAAVRAAELAMAAGDPDEAWSLVDRAIDADPWSERAHRVLVEVHLVRRDRGAARRALARCYEVLAELGAQPEAATAALAATVAG